MVAPSSKTPTISAVIPVHDRERLVSRAIESALGQSRPPVEVVVVDDGSTDGTAAAVRRFEAGVRIVEQPNRGAAAARNRGVDETGADWIAFLDSDDYWLPDHLERMAGAIQATDGGAALYFADTRRPQAEGLESHWEASGFAISGEYELAPDAGGWVTLARQPMMLQSSVFDRRAYLDAGGMRDELRSRHDTHLFFKLCLGRPACAVAGVGAEMTAEGGTKRVTVDIGRQTSGYWIETFVLYSDVLSGGYPLTRPQRRELSRRLAHAHVRLATFRWREGRAAQAAAHVVRAFRTSPRGFLADVSRRVGLSRAS